MRGNIFHNEREAPSFDDVNNDNDVHIGKVDQLLASMSHPSSAAAAGNVSKSNRYRGKRKGNADINHEGEDEEDGQYFLDPTVAHVRTGSILLPIEMTVPSATIAGAGAREEKSEERNNTLVEEIDGEDPISNHLEPAARKSPTVEPAPSFSVKQSRVSLFAAFPPPSIVVRPNNNNNNSADGPMYDESELMRAQRKLKQYSGVHAAVAATSATSHSEGYAETTLSLNYRPPSLISLPTLRRLWHGSKRRQKLIANAHCNLRLGPNAKTSLGSTFYTLDGRSQLCLDLGNPFHHNNIITNYSRDGASRIGKKGGIIRSPSSMSDYTIAASHDVFFASSNPLRANWVMKWSPVPLPTFLPSNTISRGSVTPLHLQHFNFTLATNNGRRGTNAKRLNEGMLNRPSMSLSLGYGMPLTGSEGLWLKHSQSCLGSQLGHENAYLSCANEERATISANSSYGPSLKLDAEQQMSTAQSCRGAIEYQHSGQVLSLGTMLMRTCVSSGFSRFGFGVRHAFGNVFSSGGSWWKKGSTSWLFQLERGDVRFLIPVTIYPQAITAWDSLLRIFCASLVSIVADTIAAELLCGVTSKLRLNFLKLILGEEKVGEFASSEIYSNAEKEQEDEEQWLQQQLSKVQEDTSRQVNLMIRQASAVTRKEEALGGLVIVTAIYGVIDEDSRQWLCVLEKRVENTNVDEKRWHNMDATTQMQFWVQDSSLHLPAVSKKHMLGFYDVLAFVSEQEYNMKQKQSSSRLDEKECDKGFVSKWFRPELWDTAKRRDLAVVLSIRYKWDGKIYDVMFYDDDAVDLPSQYAQEVDDVKSSIK